METVDVMRSINLVLRLATVVLCVMAWRERPRARLWVIAPLSYALNGVVFYVLVLSRTLTSPEAISTWSSSLGLHVGFLILGGVWLFLWPRGQRK